jgi:hypothetical protein
MNHCIETRKLLKAKKIQSSAARSLGLSRLKPKYLHTFGRTYGLAIGPSQGLHLQRKIMGHKESDHTSIPRGQFEPNGTKIGLHCQQKP